MTPVFGPLARVPLRVEVRGQVGISERDSRAVPNPPREASKG